MVDLEGYTEICLGLTGWTTGYDVAFDNYVKNKIDPWAQQETSEEEVLASGKGARSMLTVVPAARLVLRSATLR